MLVLFYFRLHRMEALALLCDAHLTENFALGQTNADDDLMQQLREVRILINK